MSLLEVRGILLLLHPTPWGLPPAFTTGNASGITVSKLTQKAPHNKSHLDWKGLSPYFLPDDWSLCLASYADFTLISFDADVPETISVTAPLEYLPFMQSSVNCGVTVGARFAPSTTRRPLGAPLAASLSNSRRRVGMIIGALKRWQVKRRIPDNASKNNKLTLHSQRRRIISLHIMHFSSRRRRAALSTLTHLHRHVFFFLQSSWNNLSLPWKTSSITRERRADCV